jgi:hypothetical protein
MDNQQTPETDGAEIIFSPLEGDAWVPASISRKLERERDEARELHKNSLREREAAERESDATLERANQAERDRNEALIDRANGDIATMTINHYERLLRERDEAREKVEQQRKEIVRLNGATNHAGGTPLKIALRERDEAMAEIQRLRLDAQREAEQHDRMVKELEGLYDQLAKTKSSNEHICSFSKDIMGDCIICKKELGNDTFEQDGAKFKLHKECVTEELQEEINQLLRPLQYRKDGKLIFSYVHKEKEII